MPVVDRGNVNRRLGGASVISLVLALAGCATAPASEAPAPSQASSAGTVPTTDTSAAAQAPAAVDAPLVGQPSSTAEVPQQTIDPATPRIATPSPAEEVVVIAPTPRTSSDGILSMPELPRLGDIQPMTPAGAAAATPPAPSALPSATERPAAPRAIREPTPREIAANIAPAFNVDRDYNRLVQCYGTANFAEALFRVQARRAGSGSPAANAAAQTGALKDAMQPIVLAASTVHGESKFRTDYGAVGDRWQREFAAARDPQAVLQRSLATVNACRTDIGRWRGGR